MEQPKAFSWPDEENRMLQYEAFVAEIMKRRALQKSGESQRPWWGRLLEPTVLVALITVVVGGLFGGFITTQYQKWQKEREFQQAWMKARGDQALSTYKEYLDQEQEIVKRVYELVGTCMSSADDLISLTGPEFAPGSYEGADEQRAAVRAKYNSADEQWRSQKDKLGLLMSYYHRGQTEVDEPWRCVRDAVSKYADCARRWYLLHLDPVEFSNACKDERTDLKRGMEQLSISLTAAQKYAWEGWESPERLRASLER